VAQESLYIAFLLLNVGWLLCHSVFCKKFSTLKEYSLIPGKYKFLLLSVDLHTRMYFFNIITVGHAIVSILPLFNLCYLHELQ